MTGEVGTKIVESKATYINNVADSSYVPAFCKRLLGNDYEQRSVKTLRRCPKEVVKNSLEVIRV